MAHSMSAAFLLCFLISICASSYASDYDFFTFSIKWPGANCNHYQGECCLPDSPNCPALGFHVGHLQAWKGLGPYPKRLLCQDPQCKFYINAIRDQINDLNLYWSDFRCPSSNGMKLWEREWCQYGTCTGLSEADYFRKALALRTSISTSLTSVLIQNGYLPGDGTTYYHFNLKRVVNEHFGKRLVMQCTWDFPTSLQSFTFCIYKDFTLMDCPSTFEVKDNCGLMTIPPLRYAMLQGGDKCTDNKVVADE